MVITKNIILAGGGHAHLLTLANLDKFIAAGHKVTVVQPSVYHYYSGMGPGLLGGTCRAAEIRFATRDLVEFKGGTFLKDKVIKINAGERILTLASGENLSYDILSLNTGSYVPDDLIKDRCAENIFTVKPIETLLAARSYISKMIKAQKVTITVIGGGPAAVEVVGNLWRLVEMEGEFDVKIKLCAGRKLLARFPEKVRQKVYTSFRRRGIEIIEKGHVEAVYSDHLILKSGEKMAFDSSILAPGVKPSKVALDSGLKSGPDGGLLVNRFLQSPQYPEIFGGGDCIHFADHPLDKVGVYAVRQNPILYHNLKAALAGKSLQPFTKFGGYLLIFNLGDATGILHKWGITITGKPIFALKEMIDRKFVHRFQNSGKQS